jgi:hypothetical protein
LSPGALHAQIQVVGALPQDLPEERIRRDQEPDPVAAERRAAEIGQVILGPAVEDPPVGALKGALDVEAKRFNLRRSECEAALRLVEEHGVHAGARLTGAGWGGAVIAVMPEEREQAILAAVAADFEKQYGRQPTTWATRAAAGVRGEK